LHGQDIGGDWLVRRELCLEAGDVTDGDALKFPFDDFPDFFEGVEPGEDLGGGLGAVEAVVQEVADGAWEMGDFTVARVHSFGLVQVSVFHHGNI
jgi:hypothetical protein